MNSSLVKKYPLNKKYASFRIVAVTSILEVDCGS